MTRQQADRLAELHQHVVALAKVEMATALHDDGLPPGFDASHVRQHRIVAQSAFTAYVASLTQPAERADTEE